MFAQICADDVQRYPGLKVLYLRKSVTAAREQIRGLLLSVCKGIPHNYREQAGTIEFPNGSYVVVNTSKTRKDIENFLGQEYDVIAIEELTTLTFDKWKNLMTCLRTSKPGWRPRFYGAWNWGGVGHFWTMKVFYEPWEKKTERQTRYILARVDDNKFNNPEYIPVFEKLISTEEEFLIVIRKILQWDQKYEGLTNYSVSNILEQVISLSDKSKVLFIDKIKEKFYSKENFQNLLISSGVDVQRVSGVIQQSAR